jgi:hypothetical protein
MAFSSYDAYAREYLNGGYRCCAPCASSCCGRDRCGCEGRESIKQISGCQHQLDWDDWRERRWDDRRYGCRQGSRSYGRGRYYSPIISAGAQEGPYQPYARQQWQVDRPLMNNTIEQGQ